jgi:hypothetical protein
MAVSVNDVLDSVADAAHVAGRSALSGFWDGMAARALSWANRDITAALAGLGLTSAQIASWVGLDAAVSQLALYFSLIQGGALLPSPPDQRDIDALDLRDRLPDMVLVDASGAVIRADPSSGIVGRGVIKGGFADVAARDPERRTGFVDPSTGRFRKW